LRPPETKRTLLGLATTREALSTGAGNVTDATMPPKTVPIFVALGYQGRTTVSCDDGKTWIANRSDDDAVECFNPTDCGTTVTPGEVWRLATVGSLRTLVGGLDGILWDELEPTSFVGSHPITYMVWARAISSSVCGR
jgi:hypothetical protein